MNATSAKELTTIAHQEIMCFSGCLHCPYDRSSDTEDVLRLLSAFTKLGVRVDDIRALFLTGIFHSENRRQLINLDPARGGFGGCISRGDMAISAMLCVSKENYDVFQNLFTASAGQGFWIAYREQTKDSMGYDRRAHIAIMRTYKDGTVPSEGDMLILRKIAEALGEVSPVPVSLEVHVEPEKFGDWKK